MKSRITMFFLGGFAVLCIAMISAFSYADYTAKEAAFTALRKNLANSKSYTLEVMDALPAEKYSYKPTEEVRSFSAQAYHILYSCDFYANNFKGESAEWKPGDEDSKTKEELMAWAEESFNTAIATIEQSEYNDRLHSGIVSFLDHNAHHRGQMVTYLRLNGIKPPQYK